MVELEHFEGVLVEQQLADDEAVKIARAHFALSPPMPLDVILPAVEVGPKRGTS